MTKKQAIAIITKCAKQYQQYLEGNQVVFVYRDEYNHSNHTAVRFHSHNFLHFTGVNPRTGMNANMFYRAALNNRLSENDFSFKNNHTTELKLKVLGIIMNIDTSARMIGTNTNDTKEVEVTYNQSASYMVTIPKTITLDENKTSNYSVKVEGDIPSDKNVYVTPIDVISETTNTIDFYMHDQSVKNPKEDVVATINQIKEHWNFEEVANGVEETNNTISASNLSAGNWSGTFNFNINLKDPHKHTYTSTITKEATCTKKGVKTFTCIDGDDSYTEEIPMIEHNYVKGVCTNCGAENYGEDVTLTSDNLTTYGIANSGDVVIPSAVMSSDGVWHKITSIGKHAFMYCSSLKSIEIPNSVTSIGDGAFYGCSSLTSITIPDSVTSIGKETFQNCSKLTSITIPNNVTSIGDGAFYGCSSLTSIEIPSSVTSIGIHAFSACSKLTSITIPDNVTSIEDSTFKGCSSLTSITIPDSVTSIKVEAFYKCTNLASVTYKGTTYTNKQELTNALKSNGVTVEYNVFYITKLS